MKCATPNCTAELSIGSPALCPTCQSCQSAGNLIVGLKDLIDTGKKIDKNRERSLALTAMEEATLWLEKDLRNHGHLSLH